MIDPLEEEKPTASLDRSGGAPSSSWPSTFGIGRPAGRFDRTRWTQVARAVDGDGTVAKEALAELCERYWYPLYAWLRCAGQNREDAQDLIQGFFARLLERGWLADADPDKGKLRTFLLTALKRHVQGEWRKANAQKRPKAAQALELNYDDGEERYLETAAENESPDKHYERQWAINLLGRVTEALRAEYAERGIANRYDVLKEALQWNYNATPYSEMGQQLGLTENAVKQAVSRMRRQYRRLLVEELQSTLDTDDPGVVERELGYLAAVFGS